MGPTGVVYVVEFSHRSGRDLVNIAKKRTNIIPIIEDDRHPTKYQMLIGTADVIFSDVAQPDQCVPITINVGTNNGALFNDEFYIRLRQRRSEDILVAGDARKELMDGNGSLGCNLKDIVKGIAEFSVERSVQGGYIGAVDSIVSVAIISPFSKHSNFVSSSLPFKGTWKRTQV